MISMPGLVSVVGYCQWDAWECGTCGGEGRIGQEAYSHIEEGQLLRRRRILARASLREMAKEIMVETVELSDMERGRRPITDEVRAAYKRLAGVDTC